jgi:uncharacterized membrane protein YjjP (DUF1212 family)
MADKIENVLQQVEAPINDIISKTGVMDLFKSDTITGTVAKIFLVLYGGAIAPRFPQLLEPLANNLIFKVIFFMLLAYTANSDPSIAITTAVVFLVSMMFLEKKETENFIDFSAKGLMDAAKNAYNTGVSRATEMVNQVVNREGFAGCAMREEQRA